jgi:hypothetical protein
MDPLKKPRTNAVRQLTAAAEVTRGERTPDPPDGAVHRNGRMGCSRSRDCPRWRVGATGHSQEKALMEPGLLAPLPLPTFELDPLWGSTVTHESKPLAVPVQTIRRVIVQARELVWEREPGLMWGRYSRRRRVKLKTCGYLGSIVLAGEEQIMGEPPGIPAEVFAANAFSPTLATPPLRKGQRVRITLSGRGVFDVLVLVQVEPRKRRR